MTGRYGRFGRQAAHGLRVWQQLAGEGVELEIEDDGSDPEAFAALSLSGKSLTADEVQADPVNAGRLKESLEALREILSQANAV